MNTLEAYQMALNKAAELENSGIKIVRTPYDQTKRHIEDIQALVEKYPDLPIDKWVNIKFYVNNIVEIESVVAAINYLSLLGIGFDRGGCATYLDWELDWSFDCDNTERMEDIETTNDLVERIKECNE